MSKITLEPNSSGAGTFSIVSPNSNTNRTLNLPDEAGKILSTGNNDPAEVFKQSNILGTVSESGGVPTGAIIESGSNSNGEFIKYADGTMICLIIAFRGGDSITKPSGLGFRSSAVAQTLPANFIDTNYFFSIGEVAPGIPRLFKDTTSRIGVCHFWVSSTSTSIDLQTTCIVIGRWY